MDHTYASKEKQRASGATPATSIVCSTSSACNEVVVEVKVEVEVVLVAEVEVVEEAVVVVEAVEVEGLDVRGWLRFIGFVVHLMLL